MNHARGEYQATTALREIVDDRWQTIVTGPDRRGRAGTSELYDRLTSAVGELAVRIVHGLRDGGHEEERLVALTYRVEQFVEHEVKAFAMDLEVDRRAGSEVDHPEAARSR